MRVEAWVVALRNAAAPNDVGIVHPLLRRFQGGAASMIVFGLPAVLVRGPSIHLLYLFGAHVFAMCHVGCSPQWCACQAVLHQAPGRGDQQRWQDANPGYLQHSYFCICGAWAPGACTL